LHFEAGKLIINSTTILPNFFALHEKETAE